MNAIADHLPTDERQALDDLAHRFARKELPAHLLAHEFPWRRSTEELVRAATDAGLFAINLPTACGGCGFDASALAGVLREIAAVDGGVAGLLFTHAAATELVALATDGVPGGALAEALAGEGATPLAFAACQAPEEMLPLPRCRGDETPRLTGNVPFLVLGGSARYALVAASRGDDEPYGWYLVDLHAAGVTRSPAVLTLGFQCCSIVDLTLTDAPALAVGAANDGERLFRALRARMATAAAGISLGLMEGAFATALDYARQRRQGGRQLVDWSGLRMKLADMALRIDVARTCLAGLLAAPDERAALAVALHLNDLACTVTSEGMQLLGGNGYMKDFGQEKRLRDARQARTLLGLHGLKKLHYLDTILTETAP